MKLLSVNVSLPKEVIHKGKTVRTGIYKEPVSGRVAVKKLNIEGDGQADLIGHGGEMRAVYVYSFDNYKPWEEELHRNDFVYGQFGENFTVEGMLDQDIRIGDRYRIGTALFEVSQPRVPCYKLAMKMEVDDFYSRILNSGRLGFYFRVIEEGEVGAGDEIVPVSTSNGEVMNITEINNLMYFDKQNYKGFEKALTFKALSPGWSNTFKDRLAKRAKEEEEQKAYQSLVVSKIIDESDTIRSFYLTPKEGKTVKYSPGQFLPIKLDIPGQYESVYRTYTISNTPGKESYRLTIKREDAPLDVPGAYPGVSSTYFHKHVEEGTEILAATPRGKFVLNMDNQRPIVLISAGVGVTPMISMLEYYMNHTDSRPIYFIHGARNGAEHAFKEKIQRTKRDGFTSHISYSKPLPGDELGADYDAKGRVDIDLVKGFENQDADFYVCGPIAFMNSILHGLVDWGVPKANIHFEIFSSNHSTESLDSFFGRQEESSGSSSGIGISFSVSGLETEWDDSFDSILEFAESKGFNPAFSCRSGICQTCMTEIESGEVTYDPEPLQDPDEGHIYICCSKPTKDIKLKL